MTDSKKRSGKRGRKKSRGWLAAVGRALAGGRRGGGARNVRSDDFPRPGLARLTLKDGGDPMGEKETSKKEATRQSVKAAVRRRSRRSEVKIRRGIRFLQEAVCR